MEHAPHYKIDTLTDVIKQKIWNWIAKLMEDALFSYFL